MDSTTSTTQQDIDKLNQELELTIPSSILTEMIPVWNKFHHLCRFLWVNKLMDKPELREFKEIFTKIPDKNKDLYVNEAMKSSIEKVEINDDIKELIIVQEMTEKVNNILPHLPEDLRKEVISIMQYGRNIYDDPDASPDENLAEIEAQLVEYDALEAFRAIRANPLNTKSVGGVLSKDDIAHIIDAEYDSDYDFDEQYSQPTLQAPLPIAPQERVDLPPITTPGEYITASPTASQRARPVTQPISQPEPITLRAPAPGKPLIIPARRPVETQKVATPVTLPNIIATKPKIHDPSISPADQSVTDYYSRPVNGVDDLLNRK
jgi:hypothetical protein